MLLTRSLVENSIVCIEKRLAALLVAGGRDVWLGNAPGYALSSGPWGLQLHYETLKRRPLLPAHYRPPCAVPFHCVDALRSLSARDVERVKRSSGSAQRR